MKLPVLSGTLQKDGDVSTVVKGGKFLLQSRKQFDTLLEEQGRQFFIQFFIKLLQDLANKGCKEETEKL